MPSQPQKLGILLVFIIAACKWGAPALPEGALILDGPEASQIFDQCSRSVPEPGTGFWRPSAQNVLAFEAALPAELNMRMPGRWTGFPHGWSRRYVGIVRDQRRYIYASFSPGEQGDVCDGGPAFFGAEFDVERAAITHLDFNGEA